MLLKGKAVLITGGSAGIGRATAIACAEHGADVGINFFDKSDDSAASVLEEIRGRGRKGFAVKSDVADPDAAEEFVAQGLRDLGRLDVFVSNAGICPFHGFLDIPRDIVERTFRVNLHGAYYMVQAAARAMVSQGSGGAITAISSISALVGGEYQTHYTPTKAGVLSLMQSTAIALGKHRIRCNAILPGTILTDINKDDLSNMEKRRYFERRIPLGRLGEPEDVAGPVVFLASELARYVTGAALLVDGGMFVNLQ